MAKRKKKSNNYRFGLSGVLFVICLSLFTLLIYNNYSEPLSKVLPANITLPSLNNETSVVLTDAEIPVVLNKNKQEILQRKGYTVSYNPDWKIPNWVAYELTGTEVGGKAKRSSKFFKDPETGFSAVNADYTHSGYDRGHMAPAADMAWEEDVMRESFYFTNICPQDKGLNRGIWKKLEESCRKWAVSDSAILIACGPIVTTMSKTIGVNNVVVPDQFYKVIVSPYGKNRRGIAFVFDNKDVSGLLSRYSLTIDSVETLTGIDFFKNMPDKLENELEKQNNPEMWRIN